MKKVLLSALLLVLAVMTSGCWDKREINDLSLVVGTAFDQVENPEGEPEVRITLQIANPAAMFAGGGGMGGAGGAGGVAKAFWTTSETGGTLREASMKLNYRNPRRLFFGHTRVFILGEKAARSGAAPFTDRLVRSHETRENTYVVMARGEAKAVLEQETPVFRTSALALNDAFTLKDGTQAIMAVSVNDFLYRLNSKVTCPVAPVAEVAPQTSLTSEEKKPGVNKNTVIISGIGVFSQEGKLLDFFNERETLGLMTVLNKVKNRGITVPCPIEGVKERINLGIFKSTSQTVVSIGEDGLPSFEIKIKTYADVWEHFGEHPGMFDIKFIQDLEKNASNEIAAEIETTVKKAQLLNCDVFGFGEEVRRQHHQEWHQLKDQWKEIFPEIDVTVECETSIRHRGLTIEAPGSRREEITE